MNWRFKNQFFGKASNVFTSITVGASSGSVRYFLGIALLLSSLSACHDKEALKQALIEKTVKEKVANFKQKKITTCTKEALEEAVVMADSVMINLALSQVDTNSRGNRPAKPARPELDLPVDTTPIKPLFEDTIVQLEDTTILLKKGQIDKSRYIRKIRLNPYSQNDFISVLN